MSRPTPLSSLALLLSASLRLTSATPTLTDDSKCGCYLTNGTIKDFFTSHEFYDFRDLSRYQGVPQVLTDSDASANAPLSSNYFTSPDWNNSWTIQAWNTSISGARTDASVVRVNSPQNVYIEANTDPSSPPSSKTYLTLRTARLDDFQTSAEIESKSTTYRFLSVRMLARTIGSAGAVTALFTYRGGATEADVQEADLEILTKDPRTLVRYTNQPSVSPEGEVVAKATANATLPNGLGWSDWAVHRLDWTPTQSTWYVDGAQTANISFQVPRDPAQVILNAWSDGGGWSGNMTLGGAAYMQIQWVEMVYNSTEKAQERREGEGEKGCRAVCSVDETSKTGQPVMLWDTSSGAAGATGPGAPGTSKGAVGWIPIWLVLGMVVLSW
ncbi:glycoside hydrolase family 16 protein [Coniochaeta sp. 2T2.1]|nr:glycoside hydrolase family 16 protein [Coniochaeta sp. 2T2.1]